MFSNFDQYNIFNLYQDLNQKTMTVRKAANLLLFCILLFFLSCKQDVNVDTVEIVAGNSKLMGSITPPDAQDKDSIIINISVLHPISGENVRYEAVTDQSGKFSLDFDMETDTTYIALYTSVNLYKSLMIKMINGGVTDIDIVYNSNQDFKHIEATPDMNKYDMRQSNEVLSKMITYQPEKPDDWVYPSHYDKSPNEFLNSVKRTLSKTLVLFVDNDNLFSNEWKRLISKDFLLFMYRGDVFDYEGQMTRNYRNATQDRDGEPEIQKIDRSYFRFLRDFDLNDSQYLHAFSFPEFQNEILQNEVLGLPIIGDQDITTWLSSVKSILADLIGFDEGPYYDILVANAYALQLNEQVQPLSEKQKENITQYWGNGEIAKILFRKNNEVVELDKVKSPTVVHDVSSVPADKILEAIVSKYKDKVLLIDLWATWCGPCLEAMKEFRSAKGEFQDKDVVFVYMTNGSSPKNLWEEKIQGIGSEHYYLTDDQWQYIMDHFGFEGIPSYVLYNNEGALNNKFTGFSGNDAVKKMIDDLL